MAKRTKRRKTGDGEVSVKVVPKIADANQGLSSLRRDWLWGLILFAAVILTYSPVWWAGFIWDDDDHVTANPCIIGPLGLAEIWTTSEARYYPLVLTTFWIEHALWGLQPLYYHLVNVFMHGACAFVLWRVLRSLQVPGAWLGAALWALHPIQVESVAWITELKNVQSCFFYLLSILFFIRWLRGREVDGGAEGGWNYALTPLFAALAMTSKSSTVGLPLVLCLGAWWIEGRWSWRSFARVVPVFAMSAGAALMAMYSVEIYGDVHDPQWIQSWPERMVTAGNVFWFYLGKLVWPYPLVFIYPRWKIDAGDWLSYLPLAAAIMLLSYIWYKREKWARPYFFALVYFLVALLPVLGLVQHYFLRYSFVSDHLQYLASMGPLALAGSGLVLLSNKYIPSRPALGAALGAGLLLLLSLVSWERAWTYKSDEILWIDTLSKNADCWMAYTNLGNGLLEKGQVDQAIQDYQKALHINPNTAPAYNSLGFALVKKGQIDVAIPLYQNALRIYPDYAEAHCNLAYALLQKGRVDDAIEEFRSALKVRPDYAEAYNGLGNALVIGGRVDEAIQQYQNALKRNPNYAEAHYGLGFAFVQKGQMDEAIQQYQNALESNPGYAEAYVNLGNALFQKGQLGEAIQQYQNALKINPKLAPVYNNLGNAFLQKGQINEAIVQFRRALQLMPDNALLQKNLARAQAMERQAPISK